VDKNKLAAVIHTSLSDNTNSHRFVLPVLIALPLLVALIQALTRNDDHAITGIV
jgi:hypothetical protein